MDQCRKKKKKDLSIVILKFKDVLSDIIQCFSGYFSDLAVCVCACVSSQGFLFYNNRIKDLIKGSEF